MNDFKKFVIYIRNSFLDDMLRSDDKLSDNEIADFERKYQISTQEITVKNPIDKSILFIVIDKDKQREWKFIISTVAFLFRKSFKEHREHIIQHYGVRGIVTIKKQFFQHSTIPMAFIMLGKGISETWFTAAASIYELEAIIFDLHNYQRRVNYTKNVDPENLMPEFYNDEYEEIDNTLDQKETKNLFEIADIIAGKGARLEEFAPKGIPYLRARNLLEDKIKPAEIFIKEELAVKFAKQLLQVGDMLLSKNFGEHRLSVVTENDIPAIASNSLFIIRAITVPVGYLYQYFTSETGKAVFKSQLDRIVKGATIPSINLSDLKNIRVPIYDTQTMAELAEIKKYELKKAMEFTAKLSQRITESQVEQMVIGQLIQAGWNSNELIYNNREYTINLKGRKWTPDIVLFNEGEIMAIVEVKSPILNINQRWLEQVTEMLQGKETKMVILTTGMFYDVYLTETGNHIRYESAPTKEELKRLVESEVQ